MREVSHGHGSNIDTHPGNFIFAETDLEHNEKFLEDVLLAHQFLTVAVRLSRQVVDINVFMTLCVTWSAEGGEMCRRSDGSASKKAGQISLVGEPYRLLIHNKHDQVCQQLRQLATLHRGNGPRLEPASVKGENPVGVGAKVQVPNFQGADRADGKGLPIIALNVRNNINGVVGNLIIAVFVGETSHPRRGCDVTQADKGVLRDLGFNVGMGRLQQWDRVAAGDRVAAERQWGPSPWFHGRRGSLRPFQRW